MAAGKSSFIQSVLDVIRQDFDTIEFNQHLKAVQALLGATSGDVAGVFFSDCDADGPTPWDRMSRQAKLECMESYIALELSFLAEATSLPESSLAALIQKASTKDAAGPELDAIQHLIQPEDFGSIVPILLPVIRETWAGQSPDERANAVMDLVRRELRHSMDIQNRFNEKELSGMPKIHPVQAGPTCLSETVAQAINHPFETEPFLTCLGEIQDLIGQTDGGFADLFFDSTYPGDTQRIASTWDTQSPSDRLDRMISYISSELRSLSKEDPANLPEGSLSALVHIAIHQDINSPEFAYDGTLSRIQRLIESDHSGSNAPHYLAPLEDTWATLSEKERGQVMRNLIRDDLQYHVMRRQPMPDEDSPSETQGHGPTMH